MAGINSHLFPFISPTHTVQNAQETFAIKQEEESDSENSGLDRIVQNCTEEFVGEVDKDATISVKKEANSPANGVENFQGSGRLSRSEIRIPKDYSSLSQGFGFIRLCLNVVLNVDSEKRHELVQAMSSKLKYIEAITTGKNIAKVLAVKSEMVSSSVAKLLKVRYNSRGQQYDSDGSDEEEGSESQQDEGAASNNETEEEMVNKIRKSSYAVKSRKEGLVTDVADGSVLCNVCDRIICNVRRVCAACSTYVSRTRTKCRELGLPLPSCHHKNFSGGASCQSCRLRKYILLSKRDAVPPSRRRWKVERSAPKVARKRRRVKRQGGQQKCMICERMSSWFKGWRCSACFMFHARLIKKYQAGVEFPKCSHDGFYAGVGCKGCRFKRLQRETERREPELASRLGLSEIFSAKTTHSDNKDNDRNDVST